MNSTADQLAHRLASELGDDSVTADPAKLASRKVEGKIPALLCIPASEEQLSVALRLCSETRAAVVPWGGGTAMALGNAPRHLDVVLSTERLDRVIDHDHANLTVTVESGVILACLQHQLADHTSLRRSSRRFLIAPASAAPSRQISMGRAAAVTAVCATW